MKPLATSPRLAVRGSAAAVALLLAFAACSKVPPPPPANAPHHHEHHPPHGGTPVVLGEEVAHVELVRDAVAGTLSAYVLDGEMENFVRCAQPSITITATVPGGQPSTLVLTAISDPATGETVGDTSLFRVQADWLKTTDRWTGVIDKVNVRGSEFDNVAFKFPEGNDTD